MENRNFIVSARKYRPSTFSTVVGQKNLTATLRNAIATDRLAHSYLFCGSRGVGKTSCARIFAKTINCEHRTPQGDPCNECDSCRSFNEGRSFNIIELDAASNNGVEDIRSLTEQVLVPPTTGRYRVFIIDEVHMLSTQAFNAFLKTLEEPPSYIIFILATTEKHKILPTILSRCQIYDFNRITVEDIVDHLENIAAREGIQTERKALSVIATKADGALRDALSIFDQIVASSRGNVTYQSVIDNLNILDQSYFLRLAQCFEQSDVATALTVFKEIRDKGFNTHFFINGLQAFVRDLMMARNKQTLSMVDATPEEKEQLAELAGRFKPEFFYMALSLINDADMRYREASNKTFLTELLLIKLCQLLSPSPVFKGKEEGHLDSLRPLGTAPAAAAPAHKPETPKPRETKPQEPKQTAPPAAVRAVRNMKVKSLRAEQAQAAPEPQDEIAGTPAADKPGALTAARVAEAWKEYAAAFPEQKILNNLLASLVAETVDGRKVRVTVENVLQGEILENARAELIGFMERTLHMPVDMEVTVEDRVMAPAMWTDREILDDMVRRLPEAADFINSLGLKLS